MTKYSLSKGLWKGVKTVCSIALAFAVFAGLSDVTLWDLIVTHIKPLLGGLTVSGVITIAFNFAKIRSQEDA